MKLISNFTILLSFIITSIFTINYANAQTAGISEGIEEIVVTARKKEENIQELKKVQF